MKPKDLYSNPDDILIEIPRQARDDGVSGFACAQEIFARGSLAERRFSGAYAGEIFLSMILQIKEKGGYAPSFLSFIAH